MSLEEKYKNVPNELKNMKRWVGYRVEGLENGKTTKRPYNAKTGKLAKVDSEITWSDFRIALLGCEKYEFDGIGFILGNGIFGVDLDNHPNENGVYTMSEEEFKVLSDEFVTALDSYSEYSQSGKGIHIICKGSLPKGGRRKGSVEMYDSGRFFVFTGNVINNKPINEREEEVKPLWEKYIRGEEKIIQKKILDSNFVALRLNDDDLIKKILSSSSGADFYDYYSCGDISKNGNDASSADMSFCNMLAWWCNKDKEQMDRIYRSSALMRDKWDEMRGEDTYGNITIKKACENVETGYSGMVHNLPDVSVRATPIYDEETGEIISNNYEVPMNIDEFGEPIFRIKKNFKKYPYTDTGNAIRFYDYFGDLFKYNKTDKIFMFWTGKTWIRDLGGSMIRKYANKFIELLKQEVKSLEEQQDDALKEGRRDEAMRIAKIVDACTKNATRVANKAGKDAMINEFQSLFDVPIESWQFDKNDYILNTDSGMVDLKTGEIKNYDKNLMCSKNTQCKVSYEEPTTWIKFLYSVFDNGDEQETKEIVDSLQTCLGYSLTGSTREQVMFLLYGGGSNGKSTLTETIADILGTYGDNIQSSILMQQKNANNTAMYSIAKLQNKRFVETGETDDGGKLAEAQLKILTGGDMISAQFKFGNEFSFRPKFKIWMSTNNKPIIRGTDLGIWRRLFIFPFINSFTGERKDKNLPDKLKAEKEKILGWCIKGYLKYIELGENLIVPKCLEQVKDEYKMQMDIVAQFIGRECTAADKYLTECKAMYTYYKNWALDNTEFNIRESKFAEEMEKKGFSIITQNGGKKYYTNIKINDISYSNDAKALYRKTY